MMLIIKYSTITDAIHINFGIFDTIELIEQHVRDNYDNNINIIDIKSIKYREKFTIGDDSTVYVLRSELTDDNNHYLLSIYHDTVGNHANCGEYFECLAIEKNNVACDDDSELIPVANIIELYPDMVVHDCINKIKYGEKICSQAIKLDSCDTTKI
jgi:hypothetical protein